MGETIISCPQCGRKHRMSEQRAKKPVTCAKCGTKFCHDPFLPDAIIPELLPAVRKPEPPSPVTKRKSWWGNQLAIAQQKREIAEAEWAAAGHPPTSQMTHVMFISGPVDLSPNSFVYAYANPVAFVVVQMPVLLPSIEVFRVPTSEITKVEIITKERASLGRAVIGEVLAGPAGAAIGAFGFKKEEKFLHVQFRESSSDFSLIFGAGQAAETLGNKLMVAQREYLKISRGTHPGPEIGGLLPSS